MHRMQRSIRVRLSPVQQNKPVTGFVRLPWARRPKNRAIDPNRTFRKTSVQLARWGVPREVGRTGDQIELGTRSCVSRNPLMGPHPHRFTIVAAVLWFGLGLGGRAEAGMMLQTPAGLNPGDQFRFVFVTNGIRDATSTNIADYDSFVNAEAGGATYDDVVVGWLGIGSTDSVDAIDHVGQTNAPVYLSDGTLVTTSTTPAGLWSRTLVHAINLDLAGDPVDLRSRLSGPARIPSALGLVDRSDPQRRKLGSTLRQFRQLDSLRSQRPGGDLRPLYGISLVLSVPQSVPEPSALAMLGTALSVGLAIGRARKVLVGNRRCFRSTHLLNPQPGEIPVEYLRGDR